MIRDYDPARDRQQRSELRIAERGEGDCNAGENEAERNGGAGMIRGGLAREHENASPDHAADAE